MAFIRWSFIMFLSLSKVALSLEMIQYCGQPSLYRTSLIFTSLRLFSFNSKAHYQVDKQQLDGPKRQKTDFLGEKCESEIDLRNKGAKSASHMLLLFKDFRHNGFYHHKKADCAGSFILPSAFPEP